MKKRDEIDRAVSGACVLCKASKRGRRGAVGPPGRSRGVGGGVGWKQTAGVTNDSGGASVCGMIC